MIDHIAGFIPFLVFVLLNPFLLVLLVKNNNLNFLNMFVYFMVYILCIIGFSRVFPLFFF